jgi:GT2 family glycosyltransferase
MTNFLVHIFIKVYCVTILEQNTTKYDLEPFIYYRKNEKRLSFLFPIFLFAQYGDITMLESAHDLVSIIIPYTRTELVETTLALLSQQTYPHEQLEIIVVGQESNALAHSWPIKTVQTTTRLLPGGNRNAGAKIAHGTYLLFIDDDCEPAPDWVEQNLHELRNNNVGAVGGQIAGKSNAFFARCVDFSSFAFCQVNQRAEIQICSASMGIRRELFEQVNGFDETLRTCEDIDFCYRLIKLGYKTIYQPAIKVRHNHRRTTLSALLRYNYFFGRVSGLHIKLLHPGMTRRNRLITLMRSPFVYAIMLLPIALGITTIIVRTTVREYPQVLLYAPFILLAKIAFHLGTLRWIVQHAKEDPRLRPLPHLLQRLLPPAS